MDERNPLANGDPTGYDGPERRATREPDRRSRPRGGRRASDTIADVASFIYKLLTELPR